VRRAARAAPLPICLAFAAAVVAASARAENLYVIEQLVVSVNSAPDASGERIATVKSGDQVEVIERSGDQIHVRLASGTDGWIRSGYLSPTEPLRTQLAARTAEVGRLTGDVTRLQSELAAARAAPRTPAAGPPASAASAAPAVAEEAAAAPPLFANPADEAPRRIWPWALAAGGVSLALGFALGALVLDRHIRRKYGGLRIY
jgi:Bacterial SH3 domain